MLVIVGESASGKSTTEKCLCALYGYRRKDLCMEKSGFQEIF